MSPAAAHEASRPSRPRSKTVTSMPSDASRHATELPIMPPPITSAFTRSDYRRNCGSESASGEDKACCVDATEEIQTSRYDVETSGSTGFLSLSILAY